MLKPSPLFERLARELCVGGYWDDIRNNVTQHLDHRATKIDQTDDDADVVEPDDCRHVYVNKDDMLMAVYTRHTVDGDVMGTVVEDVNIYDLKAWQSVTAHTESDLVLTIDQGVHEKSVRHQNLSVRDGLKLQKQFVALCTSLPDRWKKAYAFAS